MVREDDVLLQVETDKVTIDVRYTASEPGVLKEYLVAEDDTVSVGQDVARIETGARGGPTCRLQGCCAIRVITVLLFSKRWTSQGRRGLQACSAFLIGGVGAACQRQEPLAAQCATAACRYEPSPLAYAKSHLKGTA